MIDRRVGFAFAIVGLLLACVQSARADQAQVGVEILVVSGTHTEAGGVAARAQFVPAPLVHVRVPLGKFSVFAEGIPPIHAPIQSNQQGLTGVDLSFVSATLRYRLTPTTTLGAGETIYDQQSQYRTVYDNPAGVIDQTDRSRVAGAAYEITQQLHATARSSTRLRCLINPHLTANLYQAYSSQFGSYSDSGSAEVPESGSQIDLTLGNTIAERHFALDYGVRYVNFSMKFPDGELADRNAFWMPFVGISRRI